MKHPKKKTKIIGKKRRRKKEKKKTSALARKNVFKLVTVKRLRRGKAH